MSPHIFPIDHNLLKQAQAALLGRQRIYWLVGGAGSGKTTICQALAAKFDIPVYDMDAHIYGSYHGRFTPKRHPINTQWASAPNPFAWLMALSWAEFNHFNQAALPEYVDLLIEDLRTTAHDSPLLIDGGICNPALLAQALPAAQIVCLARPEKSSQEIWEENEERQAMQQFIYQLPQPEETWRKFLYFDEQITQTIRQECQEKGIAICVRSETDLIAELAERVAQKLGIL